MGNGKRQSALLVEIIIAVLFFALSATVILNVFATAYQQSVYAQTCNSAVAEAQNLAERIYASDAPEELLSDDGFTKSGEAWYMSCDGYVLSVDLSRQETEAGTLRSAQVRALRGDEELVSIPGVCYIAEEVAQ